MNDGYPNDADGDALRRVVALGNDMTIPMMVDFFIAVRDEATGLSVAEAARRTGYRATLSFDRDDDAWTTNCTKHIVPSYNALRAVQNELDESSRPFGGRIDGWGTFGNVESD